MRIASFVSSTTLFVLILLGVGCSNTDIDKSNSTSTIQQNEIQNKVQQSYKNDDNKSNEKILNKKEDKNKTENSKNEEQNQQNLTNKTKKKTTKNSEVKLYKVLKVIDGDTIVVNYGNNRKSVRLIGIDAPETEHPNKPVQCFGRKASSKMKELVLDKKIRLAKDKISSNRDKYNRLLRHAYFDNGDFLNAKMIKQGYAYAYLKFPFELSDKFRNLERQARENKKGLWADDTCSGEKYSHTKSIQKSNLNNEKSVIKNNSDYICSYNKYDCSDFSTHKKAQKVFISCGGLENDIHNLDANGDGQACESLP